MICCICGKEIIINHGSVEMNGAYCDKCIKYVNSADVAVNKRYITTSEPTRQCLVCGCLENPYADIVNKDKPWICNECRSVILEARMRNGR